MSRRGTSPNRHSSAIWTRRTSTPSTLVVLAIGDVSADTLPPLISADGKTLAAWRADRQLVVWNIDPTSSRAAGGGDRGPHPRRRGVVGFHRAGRAVPGDLPTVADRLIA